MDTSSPVNQAKDTDGLILAFNERRRCANSIKQSALTILLCGNGLLGTWPFQELALASFWGLRLRGLLCRNGIPWKILQHSLSSPLYCTCELYLKTFYGKYTTASLCCPGFFQKSHRFFGGRKCSDYRSYNNQKNYYLFLLFSLYFILHIFAVIRIASQRS